MESGYDQHIRTEKELDLQLAGLIEIYNAHKKHNIQMFLSAGTMLGAVRAGDFIPWDWNVSVCSRAEEANPVWDEFIATLAAAGFEIKEREKWGHNAVNVFKNGIKFVIEPLTLSADGTQRMLPMHNTPARFFETPETATIRSVEFPVLSPAQEVLEWYYGNDWRIPRKVEHRNNCITGKSKVAGGNHIEKI